jgi:hypothetical protein
MTNSPSFDQQLAIETYWNGVNPLAFLPGSISAADRFVRTSFPIKAIPTQIDPHLIKAVPGATFENQAGNAASSFEPTTPFKFAPAE